MSTQTPSANRLADSQTLHNMKLAFARESETNRRYHFFAHKADIEGHNDIAAVFRSMAFGETGHALGFLEMMSGVGDPLTGLPIGRTEDNLRAAIAGEAHEYEAMYPGMARIAREEGFEDVAAWFETLANAEKHHAARFRSLLEALIAAAS